MEGSADAGSELGRKNVAQGSGARDGVEGSVKGDLRYGADRKHAKGKAVHGAKVWVAGAATASGFVDTILLVGEGEGNKCADKEFIRMAGERGEGSETNPELDILKTEEAARRGHPRTAEVFARVQKEMKPYTRHWAAARER